MQVVQLNTIQGYVERLQQDPRKVHALFRDLLINVTSFFRDPAASEKLSEIAIPKLFEGRGADETVRVWVPGCATGEEVYSIAMLMREYVDGLTAVPRVQIFATDIDDGALGAARAGRYPEAARYCLGRAPQTVFHSGWGQLCARQGNSRSLHLFPPQRHPRPAILAD
jgi:two-component system CheB/CheR fusion protein